ncbi:ribonuclease domain-containing protein [Corynebacterium tapiri]|uniref:Ribonuclease n=1 Tax=Corynebacterium tapiri TaxID=1448266 RepID=A0A5C4U286_9CORY|nr:ribonuclease domain-containing protein [Corynebacterium tapiri]TNL96577.1 ribonuclease [Corynebacterium tapiri]
MASNVSRSGKTLFTLVGAIVALTSMAILGTDVTGTLGQQSPDHKHEDKTRPGSIQTCPLDTLPRETSETAKDINAGGPYDFPGEDDSHFGNYEGVLPKQDSNYYREYTVETPGLNHRGERRIVTGGGTETDPEVWYYTDDHYESFCEIPDAEK